MVGVVESIHDLVVFGLGFEFIDETLRDVWVHVGAGLGWLRLLRGKSWWHVRFVRADGLRLPITVSIRRILRGRFDWAFRLDVVLSGLLLLRPLLWSLLILNVRNFVVGESLLNGACALLLIRDSVLLLRVNRRSVICTISCRVIGSSLLNWRRISHQKVSFVLDLLCTCFTFAEIKVLGSLFVVTVLRRCRRYVFLHVNYVSIGGTVFLLSNRLSRANLLLRQFHLVKLFLLELQLLSLVDDFLLFVNYSP